MLRIKRKRYGCEGNREWDDFHRPVSCRKTIIHQSEALLVNEIAVLGVRNAAWLIAYVTDSADAVDEDVETDLTEISAAEEADAVLIASTVLVEATSPSGKEAMG